MNQTTTYGPITAGVSSVGERNRVLRNTYWLLALSMVPTVLGAWIGVASGVARAMSPGVGLVVFLVGAFGFMFVIEKNKNSAAGVPLLLAFTFFMGLMLSRLVGAVLGLANGASLIMTAFAGTGAIFLGMATLSTVIKRDLSSMGKFLFIGPAAGGRAGELLHPVQRADDHAVGAGDRHLLRLHPLRPEARARRPRDQLHHRHAGRLTEPVQRVPVAARAAGHRRWPGRMSDPASRRPVAGAG